MILRKFDDYYNIWTIYAPEPPVVFSFRTHNLIFPGSWNHITPKFFTIISGTLSLVSKPKKFLKLILSII